MNKNRQECQRQVKCFNKLHNLPLDYRSNEIPKMRLEDICNKTFLK
jgi:hypothetical protein